MFELFIVAPEKQEAIPCINLSGFIEYIILGNNFSIPNGEIPTPIPNTFNPFIIQKLTFLTILWVSDVEKSPSVITNKKSGCSVFLELWRLYAALIADAKSVFLMFLLSKSNTIGHIWDFSESISKVFFSEQTIIGLGFPEIIKSKQGRSIAPNALNNIWIVFQVCWLDNWLKHETEESITTVTP